MKRLLAPFVAGALFALGLILGGMTEPGKVIGFLDLAGDWDPSLLFVMGGGLLVHGLLYRLVMRRGSPLFEAKFHVPSRRDIDRRLVLGAAIFGAGWGLGGAGRVHYDDVDHDGVREYGVGAQILKDLGVRRMIHMSNTRPTVLPGLDGYGLTVEGWRRIDGE